MCVYVCVHIGVYYVYVYMYVHYVTPSKCNFIYCIAKPTMECLNNHDKAPKKAPKLEISMKSTYHNALVGCYVF